jgi:hypothetical protein
MAARTVPVSAKRISPRTASGTVNFIPSSNWKSSHTIFAKPTSVSFEFPPLAASPPETSPDQDGVKPFPAQPSIGTWQSSSSNLRQRRGANVPSRRNSRMHRLATPICLPVWLATRAVPDRPVPWLVETVDGYEVILQKSWVGEATVGCCTTMERTKLLQSLLRACRRLAFIG